MAKPDLGFKIWTAFLSVFVTAMLFIFGKFSFWKSLLLAAIAVAAISIMHFVVGRAINRSSYIDLRRKEEEKQR